MYRVRPGRALVLASASPRRREMLGRLGILHEVAPAKVDESLLPGEDARQAARRLALAKARAVAGDRPGAMVLAADTLVTLEGAVLGKPRDADEALAMLQMLSGREHEVVTGFCLVMNGREECALAVSQVRFRELGAREMEAYVASGEPMGKAGAYAVQGLGAALVEAVGGSYTNVVGLPLAEVVGLLLGLGVIEPWREA